MRIALDDHQVGLFAGCQRANVFRFPKKFGAIRGSVVNGFEGSTVFLASSALECCIYGPVTCIFGPTTQPLSICLFKRSSVEGSIAPAVRMVVTPPGRYIRGKLKTISLSVKYERRKAFLMPP